MICKLTDLHIPDKEWEKKWGDFNEFPPNWKEITEKEFAQSHFFVYSPDYMEMRQMITKSKRMVEARLFFLYDGTGYGLEHDYWAGKVRYYKFAECEHEYKELTQSECKQKGIMHFGNCYHVNECAKCGFINAIDSSD